MIVISIALIQDLIVIIVLVLQINFELLQLLSMFALICVLILLIPG
jgi:hypothetical protein